jgi:hypothetical protein
MSLRLRSVCFALAVCIWPAAVRAQDPAKLSSDSVARLIAAGVGMSKDAVSTALGDAPGSLKNATDALTVIKVVSLASAARDDDAYQTAVDGLLGKVLDKALDKTVAGTALTAVQLYKSTLEVTKEYVVLPRMDENTYRLYVKMRGTNPTDRELKGTAFQAATQGAGSYGTLKKTMYARLLASRGLREELVQGTRTDSALWKSIDAYWEGRLEARWQREWIAAHKDSLIADVWAKQKVALQVAKYGQPVRAQENTAEEKALIAEFVAGEEAHAKALAERYRAQGYTDAQFKVSWLYGPVIKNGVMEYAVQMMQKIDKDHPWTDASTLGDAAHPARLPVGQIRRSVWKP